MVGTFAGCVENPPIFSKLLSQDDALQECLPVYLESPTSPGHKQMRTWGSLRGLPHLPPTFIQMFGTMGAVLAMVSFGQLKKLILKVVSPWTYKTGCHKFSWAVLGAPGEDLRVKGPMLPGWLNWKGFSLLPRLKPCTDFLKRILSVSCRIPTQVLSWRPQSMGIMNNDFCRESVFIKGLGFQTQ